MYFKTCVHTRYVWIKTRKYSSTLSPVLVVVVVVSGCQAEVRTNTRTLFSARDIMAYGADMVNGFPYVNMLRAHL